MATSRVALRRMAVLRRRRGVIRLGTMTGAGCRRVTGAARWPRRVSRMVRWRAGRWPCSVVARGRRGVVARRHGVVPWWRPVVALAGQRRAWGRAGRWGRRIRRPGCRANGGRAKGIGVERIRAERVGAERIGVGRLPPGGGGSEWISIGGWRRARVVVGAWTREVCHGFTSTARLFGTAAATSPLPLPANPARARRWRRRTLGWR